MELLKRILQFTVWLEKLQETEGVWIGFVHCSEVAVALALLEKQGGAYGKLESVAILCPDEMEGTELERRMQTTYLRATFENPAFQVEMQVGPWHKRTSILGERGLLHGCSWRTALYWRFLSLVIDIYVFREFLFVLTCFCIMMAFRGWLDRTHDLLHWK